MTVMHRGSVHLRRFADTGASTAMKKKINRPESRPFPPLTPRRYCQLDSRLPQWHLRSPSPTDSKWTGLIGPGLGFHRSELPAALPVTLPTINKTRLVAKRLLLFSAPTAHSTTNRHRLLRILGMRPAILASFLLRILPISPIQYNLLPGRFLPPLGEESARSPNPQLSMHTSWQQVEDREASLIIRPLLGFARTSIETIWTWQCQQRVLDHPRLLLRTRTDKPSTACNLGLSIPLEWFRPRA